MEKILTRKPAPKAAGKADKPKGKLASKLANPVKGDVFAPDCPSREIMKHVTSSWGVLVLIVLQDGTHRFSELRRKVSGVSERMLAQTLQYLEGDGLVQRRSYPVVPPHVDYTLTPKGEEAAEHVAALAEWIEDNVSALKA